MRLVWEGEWESAYIFLKCGMEIALAITQNTFYASANRKAGWSIHVKG